MKMQNKWNSVKIRCFVQFRNSKSLTTAAIPLRRVTWKRIRHLLQRQQSANAVCFEHLVHRRNVRWLQALYSQLFTIHAVDHEKLVNSSALCCRISGVKYTRQSFDVLKIESTQLELQLYRQRSSVRFQEWLHFCYQRFVSKRPSSEVSFSFLPNELSGIRLEVRQLLSWLPRSPLYSSSQILLCNGCSPTLSNSGWRLYLGSLKCMRWRSSHEQSLRKLACEIQLMRCMQEEQALLEATHHEFHTD